MDAEKGEKDAEKQRMDAEKRLLVAQKLARELIMQLKKLLKTWNYLVH